MAVLTSISYVDTVRHITMNSYKQSMNWSHYCSSIENLQLFSTSAFRCQLLALSRNVIVATYYNTFFFSFFWRFVLIMYRHAKL